MSQLSKIAVLFMACALSLSARTQVRGWCEQGNKTVVATGVSGAPKVQGSYPQCTVTVRISPAGALMAIFADDAGTVKANPFTAAVSGYYFFYVDNGKYDITLSGTVAPPFTLSDVVVTNVIGSAAVPTGVGVGNGTAWSGVVAASQLQHLRRKPNVTGTQYEFATEPTLVASDYNFPAQSPADGDLIAGDKLITLTPVPLGVNWNDAGNSHWLYVSGGTDAAGACYILTTGPGTAVSGAASGTLTLHCAAQHRGAYTVASASGGIAEAVQAAPTTGMTGDSTEIRIPNLATVYAPITVASRKIAFTGIDTNGASVTRDASFVVGHTFHLGTGAQVHFERMSIGAASNIPNYASIYCGAGASTRIVDVQIVHGFYGVLNNGCESMFIRGLIWMNGLVDGPPLAGIRLTHPGGGTLNNVMISDSIVGGYTTGANIPTVGLYISNTDGLTVQNSWFGGNADGIFLEGAAGEFIQNIWLDNVAIDSFTTFGIGFAGNASAFNTIRITDSHINGQHAGTTSNCIDIGGTYGTGNVTSLQLLNNNIEDCHRNGIWLGPGAVGSKDIRIAGNRIINNNASVGGYHGVMLANGTTGVSITGNTIGNKGEGAGLHAYGILAIGTLTDAVIEGNDLSDNGTGPLSLGGALTRVLIANNKGIDDVIGNVASGATIAAPLNPVFEVTGTTSIANITGGWTGREITLIFTNAAPGGVGTGGNIAKAQTVSQNQALPLVFNGTNWYPGGGGGTLITASKYNFSAQAPGGTLTAATPATITLAPVPRGVNHDDAGHYLYISGGTGTAEAVLITGGAGHAGDATGTITFTPANTHTGAWTIRSASAGIKEAANVLNGIGTITLISGVQNIYASLILPTTISLIGQGTSNINGNPATILYWLGGAHPAIIVAGNPAGYDLDLYTSAMGYGIHRNYGLYSASGLGDGIWVGGDPAGALTPANWQGDFTNFEYLRVTNFTNALVYQLANFVTFSNCGFNGNSRALLVPSTGGGLQYTNFYSTVLTVGTGYAVQMDASSYGSGYIAFHAGQVSGTITGTALNWFSYGTHYEPNDSGEIVHIEVPANTWGGGNFHAEGGLMGTHNVAAQQLYFGYAGGASGGSVYNVSLSNVEISDTVHTVPLFVSFRSVGGNLRLDNIFDISGGLITVTQLYSTTNSVVPNILVTQPKFPLDLTAATTLAFPAGNTSYPAMGAVKISGATVGAGITAISGLLQGQYGILYTASAQTFTAGATIGNTVTATAGLPYTYYFDGAQTWISGGTGAGVGSGDVVGPAASVDDEVALFSSTTGKIIKRSALTGILKSASGVAAVAGANDVSGPQFCVSAAGSDAYACNLAPAITSYVTGTHYRFKADVANTGVASVSFNGIGVIPLKKAAGGVTTDLATNDVRAGQWVDLVYDGTNMQVQSLLGNSPAVTADAVSGASALKTANTVAVVDSAGVVKEATGVTIAAGVVTATGHIGPLTGAVTGNASTATALAANPAACSNQVVTDMAANGTLVCASVVEDMLGLTNVTTGDVSASAHGLAKKISVHATDDPTGACTLGQTYHNYATPSLWECVQTGAATTAWRLKLISTGTGAGSIQFPTSGAMSVGAGSTVKIGAHTGDVLGVSLNGGAVKTVMATDTVLLEAQHPAHDGDATSSAGDLTLALAAKFRTLTKSITLLDPVAGDSGSVQLVFGQAVTITRVWCSTKTATSTVTINLEERAEATPDTAGTEVLTSALVCDTDTQASTTFSNAGIAARVPLALTIASVANAPAVVRVHLEHTID